MRRALGGAGVALNHPSSCTCISEFELYCSHTPFASQSDIKNIRNFWRPVNPSRSTDLSSELPLDLNLYVLFVVDRLLAVPITPTAAAFGAVTSSNAPSVAVDRSIMFAFHSTPSVKYPLRYKSQSDASIYCSKISLPS